MNNLSRTEQNTLNMPATPLPGELNRIAVEIGAASDRIDEAFKMAEVLELVPDFAEAMGVMKNMLNVASISLNRAEHDEMRDKESPGAARRREYFEEAWGDDEAWNALREGKIEVYRGLDSLTE